MNKKILIVLGVSLALNFLFIGFEVSRAVFEPPFPSGPAERFEFRPEGFPPPPDGGEVRADENKKAFFGAFKKALKDARKPMKASKEAVAEALRKDPFDPAALQKALDEASAVREMIDDAVQKNMLDMISKMTPEERTAFAESFEKGPRFRKHHRFRGNVRPPMPPEAGTVPPPPERREPPFPRHHRRPPMHHPEMMPPHGLPPCMRDARDGRRFMPDDYPCANAAERIRKGKPMKPEKGGKAKPAPQEGSTPQK